jgi:periplasmic copper chaperone A
MILLLLQTLPAAAGAEPNLVFTHAFVAAAPPGVSAMAAYMSIENPGSSERRITSIGSPDFAEVQMHRSSIENGVARMQQLEALTVSPGSRLELKPGGVHLMLMNPRRDFEAGEVILLELMEVDGTEHSLALKVRRAAAVETHHH